MAYRPSPSRHSNGLEAACRWCRLAVLLGQQGLVFVVDSKRRAPHSDLGDQALRNLGIDVPVRRVGGASVGTAKSTSGKYLHFATVRAKRRGANADGCLGWMCRYTHGEYGSGTVAGKHVRQASDAGGIGTEKPR